MAENNQVSINLAKKPVAAVVSMARSPKMIARFQEVLGAKAPQFLASVISSVNSNPQLMKADPSSVMASAMVAATLNLDVVPGLGFAALVPYYDGKTGRNVCQFQVMTKGFVQLGLRTGQYTAMNVTEIYADEFKGYDPLTGDVKLEYVKDGDRDNEAADKIVGYASYFRLVNGYEHTEYWTVQRIMKHALRFSKSFAKYQNGLWKDDFNSMAKKTVLKNCLSKWGPLSVEMQKAMVDDQKVYDDMESEGSYDDNPLDNASPEPPEAPEKTPVQQEAKPAPRKRAATLNVPPHAPAPKQEEVMEDNPEANEAEACQQDEGYRPLEGFDESDLPW